MYESEVNYASASTQELPQEILRRFAESRETVSERTLIPWGEHCTECVWPTCYTTCDLYEPRVDGRCRRFVNGMVRLDAPGTLNSYVLKISFKRWAKLWSAASLNLHSLEEADGAERRDETAAHLIRSIPGTSLKRFVSLKRYSMKKRRSLRPPENGSRPNCLLVECYNPNSVPVSVTVTIRREETPLAFQSLLVMEPGFNRHRIAVKEIEPLVDLSQGFGVDLTPNEIEEGLTLYFGCLDFVLDRAFEEPKSPKKPAGPADSKICKCVVWDLDNTVWSGTLVEDGPEEVVLKSGIPEIFKELDERGILLSVASKNNHDEAMEVLRKFGLAEYLLFPQISWEPKSGGVREIAKLLNIGIDSLLFVDDSTFEREEVKSVFPEVRTLDAAEYRSIPGRTDCQAPVTEESRKRRLFYREEQVRGSAQQDFQGNYQSFLRACSLRLTIKGLTAANLDRIHELMQRTNQMNFSGNRYTRAELAEIFHKGEIDTYVLDCEDRFGSYGTIGFCMVDPKTACLTDLMFSCRIQSKRVEHAFVSYLVKRYREIGRGDFFVNYRKTKKNAPSGKVFDDLGFEVIGESDGITRLVFGRDRKVPDDGLVQIEDVSLGSAAEGR